ncbi:uncharacterized protein K452DRAFT_284051 [Aplosporella prunicola CBS 121167]|uniref:Aspergillopepsin-2 n=1 Tax=Aplosporella prunicola CBS 121167 TaxID=1176127 RepID=A0A6A6BNG4_9PEZI|nr:uncharacterized protein K452DRAFT_284051 [Aplosporella prunicola CBS 121167]KAF2145689.1 hypothetical protein K452DRAFT_284051 [Aplosporella prunicola CBS 121167]
MKLASVLSTIAILATSVVAAPTPEGAMGHGLAARVAARSERRAPGTLQHLTKPLIKTGSAEFTHGINENATKTHVQYSSNWAGAVIEEPPTGTFTAVVGTFTVPAPNPPTGGSSRTTYAASAWVGIDGDTYGEAILQTGIDFEAQGDEVAFSAWYEWYPDYAYDFSLDVSEGDVIALSAKSSSSTRGTVVINNLTTGKSVSKTLSAPDASSPLGGQNAEWIVEDFESNGSLVAFADFGKVVFTGATATTSSGTTVGPDTAEIIEIKSGNTVLTDVSIDSDSQLTVTYV